MQTKRIADEITGTWLKREYLKPEIKSLNGAPSR